MANEWESVRFCFQKFSMVKSVLDCSFRGYASIILDPGARNEIFTSPRITDVPFVRRVNKTNSHPEVFVICSFFLSPEPAAARHAPEVCGQGRETGLFAQVLPYVGKGGRKGGIPIG